MTPLPLCFIISVAMLLYKSSIPVQGRVVDAKTPPGRFNETMADSGKKRNYSLKAQANFLKDQNLEYFSKTF